MAFLLEAKLRVKHTLARFRSVVIGKHATAILTTGYNGVLLVGTDDFSIGRQLAFGGEYNREEIEIISRITDTSSRLLIVGTHVGTILIPLAKKAHSVVGIEANPDTFNLLSMNVALNNCSNVRLFCLAAFDTAGQIAFFLSRANSGGSKVEAKGKPKRGEFAYDQPKKVLVEASRLDDVLPGEKFDLVIMDIEGSEYHALKGMPEILDHAKALVIEILPNHIENVAGVTLSQFLSAIPLSFTHARFLKDENLAPIPRGEFVSLIQTRSKQVYFAGCDVIFLKP